MNPSDKQNHWQRHVKACQQSGLSRKAYCKQHQLSYDNFGYWNKRLKQHTSKAKSVVQASKLIPVTPSPPIHSKAVFDLPGGICLTLPTGQLAEVLPIICQHFGGNDYAAS